MLKLKIKILKTAAQDNNTVVSKFLYQEIWYLCGNRIFNLFLSMTKVHRENFQLLNSEKI